MKKLYVETPLLDSSPLSTCLGKPVFLKMEALQPSGSFKNRGIGHMCSIYAKRGARAFVCSSGGNAGLAAAYSGRKLQIPVTIVVPSTTQTSMIEKIRLEKAEVLIKGDCWDEADVFAKSLIEKDTVYIPPFDHPLIWEGHRTLIDEVYKKVRKPGAVLVAVGGGGLLCGILEGMHQIGWHDVPVITAETEGAASYAASIQAEKVIWLNEVNTVATSLAAKQVSKTAFEWASKHTIYPKIVSDHGAIEAVLRFADDHRILVEPACGAPLSLIYGCLPLLQSFSSILVIVCGGAATSRALLSKWEKL
ncbi:MAG: Phenylserine dehydratase [Chlamydiales bacterium]|nr:Phenylserine dehydratase [Chlamydiales bacterium]